MSPDCLPASQQVSVDADEYDRLVKRDREYDRVVFLLQEAGHLDPAKLKLAVQIAQTFY